jgi:hypothetical protein
MEKRNRDVMLSHTGLGLGIGFVIDKSAILPLGSNIAQMRRLSYHSLKCSYDINLNIAIGSYSLWYKKAEEWCFGLIETIKIPISYKSLYYAALITVRRKRWRACEVVNRVYETL